MEITKTTTIKIQDGRVLSPEDCFNLSILDAPHYGHVYQQVSQGYMPAAPAAPVINPVREPAGLLAPVSYVPTSPPREVRQDTYKDVQPRTSSFSNERINPNLQPSFPSTSTSKPSSVDSTYKYTNETLPVVSSEAENDITTRYQPTQTESYENYTDSNNNNLWTTGATGVVEYSTIPVNETDYNSFYDYLEEGDTESFLHTLKNSFKSAINKGKSLFNKSNTEGFIKEDELLPVISKPVIIGSILLGSIVVADLTGFISITDIGKNFISSDSSVVESTADESNTSENTEESTEEVAPSPDPLVNAEGVTSTPPLAMPEAEIPIGDKSSKVNNTRKNPAAKNTPWFDMTPADPAL